MGFLSSTTRGLPDHERDKKRGAAVGVAIKAMYDAEPPEEGVTKLPSSVLDKEKVWNKKLGRFKYRVGVIKNGKHVGGKITSAPENAPPNRKRKKPRR